MLVLAQMETEQYLEICEEPDHIMQQVQMERETFGFDHMAVGGRLLQRWNLSPEMVEAVANHHVYLPMCPELNHTLLVANLLTDVLWNPGPATTCSRYRPVLQSRFGMGVDELITLANDTKQAVKESMVIFGVNLKVNIDVEAIEAEAREQFAKAASEEGTFLGGFDALILDAVSGNASLRPRQPHRETSRQAGRPNGEPLPEKGTPGWRRSWLGRR